MPLLKFLMLLSLVVWLGAVIFFPVVAQTAFSVLPTRHLGGLVVNRSLGILHWMGMISGVVFLASSMIHARLSTGTFRPFAGRNLAIVLMLALTLISQFGVSPKMAALRSSMGEIDAVAVNDPARVQFNLLHAWSTRLEGGVLLLGLLAVYLTAKST